MSAPQQTPRLSLIQEDDEFEEFPAEDYDFAPLNNAIGGSKTEAGHLHSLIDDATADWQYGWDDDFAGDEDFGRQLREELAKRKAAA